MMLKAQFIFEATQVIGVIISQNRPMPQKGKFRLERMHAKLMTEWQPLNAKRTEMIVAYDHKREIDGVEQIAVPLDKMEEFNKAWDDFAQMEIEVPGLAPIPLSLLDLGDTTNGSISPLELRAMGELVTE